MARYINLKDVYIGFLKIELEGTKSTDKNTIMSKLTDLKSFILQRCIFMPETVDIF